MSGNIEDGTKSRIDTEIDRNWHEFTDFNSSRLHQVGTVLLCTLGRGIGRRSLINKVEWLRGEARCKFPCYASSPLLASFGNVRCVDRVTFKYFQVIKIRRTHANLAALSVQMPRIALHCLHRRSHHITSQTGQEYLQDMSYAADLNFATD